MTAPTDQRAGVRPISFLLDTGTSLSAPVTLKIRPEDLVKTEPSRITVHQTLGRETQGWVDNFGLALPSVTISGHTGWRAATDSGDDGVAAFERLNQLVTVRYHAAKQSAINIGRDPATVMLLFVDMLDNFAWSVAPTQFVLRRNKSRPLLMQYNISMQAVSTTVDPAIIEMFKPVAKAEEPPSEKSGIESMIESINNITKKIQEVGSFIERNLVAPVRNFMFLTARLFSAVVNAISAVTGIADQLIGVARMISQSAMNIFRTFAAVASLPSIIKSKLIEVANEYSNIFCVLKNSLRGKIYYEDYSPLYGASNCSSTSGGRTRSPLAGTNPFYSMFPTQSNFPVKMSPEAQSAVFETANSDVVLNPMSPSQAGERVQIISNGMVVA